MEAVHRSRNVVTYEVLDAGYKYNMTDIQAALSIHQLRRLDGFIQRRQAIAATYGRAFSDLPEIGLPTPLPERNHTYHLYPIRLDRASLRLSRSAFIEELHARNIGTSVHFIPVHRHPFYQKRFAYTPDRFPVAEEIYWGWSRAPSIPK